MTYYYFWAKSKHFEVYRPSGRSNFKVKFILTITFNGTNDITAANN